MLFSIRSNKASFNQEHQYRSRVFVNSSRHRIKNNLRLLWCFIRVIDTGKVLDLTTSRLGIDAFGIALFADTERSVDEDFYEAVGSNHVPHIVPGRSIRTYRSTDSHTAMTDNLRGYEPYPPDVSVSIFFAESKTLITRDELMEVLHAENVLARRYFYPGCHRMEPYKSRYPNAPLLLPQTERIAAQVADLTNRAGD